MSLLALWQILASWDGYVSSLDMASTCYMSHNPKNIFRDIRKLSFHSDSGTLFVIKFPHHALVLPFLTQQGLCAVLVYAKSSLFLIPRFFITTASLVRFICKYFWFSSRSAIKIFTWTIDNPNKIIKYIN